MASFGGKSHSTHAKLHKRGRSGSSITPPPLPTTTEFYPFSFAPGDGRKVTYSDEALQESFRSGTPNNAPALKFKPYLRKLAPKDGHKIDLSRPAAENERLAGLGVHDFYSGPKSLSDVTFTPVNGRAKHNRSTSNNSQFSTASSLQRPTAPYAHPMRQTPRPYTPPIAKSYTTSMIGSEISDEALDIMSEDEYRYRQRIFDGSRRSDSISSIPTQPPPLHIHTSGSLTRLNGNQSQSSLPSAMSINRSRGDTVRSIDTVSPSSRTSMEKAVSFARSAKDDPFDPASRAASIRAARIAYNEKEAEKDRRAEKEALKRSIEETRKKAKKEDRQRRKSDAVEDKRLRSRSDLTTSNSEKVDFVGKAYNDFTPAHSRSLPAHVPTTAQQRPQIPRSETRSSRHSAKSTWVGFLAWFRTRLLRLGKKLHMTS
ncbi:hypothetical protein EJ08DRAFT_280026 [Tothia fuscella]|uniref:Uncharacterized protein n=1 Tax=Tothia fuscella TaxID=1048955 RepID=A0A9P4NQJ7_9PEZI|nr:hypothetical protein EJ08DRAFT_280026 [Tothia fuscella]